MRRIDEQLAVGQHERFARQAELWNVEVVQPLRLRPGPAAVPAVLLVVSPLVGETFCAQQRVPVRARAEHDRRETKERSVPGRHEYGLNHRLRRIQFPSVEHDDGLRPACAVIVGPLCDCDPVVAV